MSRRTRQRDAILSAFQHADRPLSPAELRALAGRSVPSLGIATVYRNVKALLDDGTLRAVNVPGQPDRYELAGKQHHHHFHCRACDGVFEVAACPGGLAALAPDGFHTEHHEIVLFGLCSQCA
ncbi:MAG TPA: transcriptional repressor [Thermoanaerobaculia bacterium]|nr:transcriptional repressor [Thermoanaerobaculia bacterium]